MRAVRLAAVAFAVAGLLPAPGPAAAPLRVEMTAEPSPPAAGRPATLTFVPSLRRGDAALPSLTVFVFAREGESDAMLAKLAGERTSDGAWRIRHTFDKARRYELRCLVGGEAGDWSPRSFRFELVVLPPPAARWRQVLLGVSIALIVAFFFATVRKTRRLRAELRGDS